MVNAKKIYSQLLSNARISEIALVVTEVMNNDFWNCSSNGEVSDPQQDVEHRVLNFNKSILY